MNILKRLFSFEKPMKGDSAELGSTSTEIKNFFADFGEVTFNDDTVIFDSYPFSNATASTKPVITAKEIINICIKAVPPTIRVGDELLYVSAVRRQELTSFAERNGILLYDRHELWDCILEPFLDTEFTEETCERIYTVLAKYNLDRQTVDAWRKRVREQMIKYNFDSMLWEWGMFSSMDVLLAMRPKLSSADFNLFYKEVMEIALRPDRL